MKRKIIVKKNDIVVSLIILNKMECIYLIFVVFVGCNNVWFCFELNIVFLNIFGDKKSLFCRIIDVYILYLFYGVFKLSIYIFLKINNLYFYN